MSAARSPKSKKVKPEEFFSPKGFRDILGDDALKYQGFFEKAQEIAEYYGFTCIMLPTMEREQVFTTTIEEGTDVVDKEMYSLKPPKSRDKLALRPEGTAGAMRAYIQNGMQSLPQPVMLYYYGPMFRHDKPQKGRYRELFQFGLEIMGTDKPIADALIIRITTLILEEAGAKNLVVRVNSIGDDTCRPAYIKELTNYYRKHIEDLGRLDRERLKTNPLRILDSKDPKTIEINENAPDAVAHLSPDCKKHFKKVLEYLEEMGICYTIDKHLVRGLSYYTNTVFEITEETDEPEPTDENSEESETKTEESMTGLTIAAGGRYDYLAKNLGFKKDVPAMGSAIGVDRVVLSDWYKDLSPRVVKKPKFYFIQLGNEAKMKSMNVIEVLRKAKLGVQQSLSKDSLGSQLGVAEKLGIPYTLIFGQKEALDGTIIVRNMKTRSQKTVAIDDLADYIKKMK